MDATSTVTGVRDRYGEKTSFAGVRGWAPCSAVILMRRISSERASQSGPEAKLAAAKIAAAAPMAVASLDEDGTRTTAASPPMAMIKSSSVA
jgi:hypothetical protein